MLKLVRRSAEMTVVVECSLAHAASVVPVSQVIIRLSPSVLLSPIDVNLPNLLTLWGQPPAFPLRPLSLFYVCTICFHICTSCSSCSLLHSLQYRIRTEIEIRLNLSVTVVLVAISSSSFFFTSSCLKWCMYVFFILSLSSIFSRSFWSLTLAIFCSVYD